MYTMGKLPTSSLHFNHETIIRTRIYLVIYSYVLNTTVFSLFKFKTLLVLFQCLPSHKSAFVRNMYIYVFRNLYIYMRFCQEDVKTDTLIYFSNQVNMYKFAFSISFLHSFIFVANRYLVTYLLIILSTLIDEQGQTKERRASRGYHRMNFFTT